MIRRLSLVTAALFVSLAVLQAQVSVVGKVTIVGPTTVGKASGGGSFGIPTRVQSLSCEVGSDTWTCTTASAVTAGNTLNWMATDPGTGGTPTVGTNCGGTNHFVDSTTTTRATFDGYITGITGGSTCTVTVTYALSGGATAGSLEEMAPAASQAIVLDQHSALFNQSVTGGNTLATPSITTTQKDYVWSWAVDAAAGGGSAPTVGSPFTSRSNNTTFPNAEGDSTQAAAGAIQATWTFNVTTTGADVGAMAFYSH